LHEAIAFNNSLLSKELIKRNININHGDTKYQTPLHYVAMQKSPEFVELILKNGGKSNLEDIYGNQALWTAVFNAKGNYTVVEAFLKFKQDVEHKNKYGKSPLDFAKQITDQFLIKILENHKNLSYSGFN
jgi:ankyrin repeat protein